MSVYAISIGRKHFFNIRVICSHVSTENKEKEIKSAFYDKPDQLYF
jgi:hypothetical protein